LVATANFRHFTEDDLNLFELICSFTTSAMEDNIIGSDNVQNYIARLLSGAVYSPEANAARLRHLGWDIRENIYALSIVLANNTSDQKLPVQTILQKLSENLNCRLLVYDASLVCIYSSEEPVENWDAEFTELRDILLKHKLAAGVSQVFHDMGDLKDQWQRACKAVELGCRLKGTDVFYQYRYFSIYHILEQLQDRAELKKFCYDKVLQLEEYDAANNTDMLKTLQVYLECGKSPTRTAEVMFLHRNTIAYRIEKCKEIMNTGFEDGPEIFAIILALKIIEYEVRRKPQQ
ncbi:MAG: hypothetical protein HGA22_12000, partial [Clostridiales bacterium]|nr:hypothetical protein [Clostridiales bacterium]